MISFSQKFKKYKHEYLNSEIDNISCLTLIYENIYYFLKLSIKT